MAICKMCHKAVPDGMDFCEECEKKRTVKADESYLDSLLSSVTADLNNYSETTFSNVAKHIAPKIISETASAEHNSFEAVSDDIGPVSDVPEDIITDETETNTVPDIPEDIISGIYDEIISDIPDENITDISDESIIEMSRETESDITADLNDLVSDNMIGAPEDIIIDIADTDVSIDIPEDIQSEISEDVSTDIPEDITADIPIDITDNTDNTVEDSPADIIDASPSEMTEDISENIIDDASELISEDITEDISVDMSDIMPEIIEEDVSVDTSDDIVPAEDSAAGDDSADVDELLDSLLADMDAAGAGEPEPESELIDSADISDIFSAIEEEHADNSSEDDSIISVEFDLQESVVELSDEMIEQLNGGEEQQGLPGIDEIDFSSDTVDSAKLDLSEMNIDTASSGAPVVPDIAAADSQGFLGEEELENSDSEGIIDPIADFDVDSILGDIESGNIDKTINSLDADKKKPAKKKEKSKKNWFQRLFANIEESPEEIAKREAKEKAEKEKKEIHEANLKKKKEQSKEDKEAQKAEKAAQKEEEAKKKAELKRQKQEEAKEKARKKKEEKLALEEFEVNEGKINRAGATILFVIFAILTVFIIVGTNIYSYNLSIKRAEDEFEIKHYNDAYYEVYGLKIQDEDIELYDKIMTVMYVNTQLNAYEYYMTSNNRDKALDSLLKGLQRYDKYLDLAELLGIKDDLNYVKNNILEELSSEFDMDEYEAVQLVETRDEIDYSEYIYALLGTYEVDISD